MKVKMLRNLPVFGQVTPKYEGEVYAVSAAEGTDLVAKLLAVEIPEIAAPVQEMPPVVPMAEVPSVIPAATKKSRGHSVSSPMGK